MLQIHSTKVWHLAGTADEVRELLEAAESQERSNLRDESGNEVGNGAYFRAEQYKELSRTILAED